ncbi:hypothetical protein BUALT_Bualt06G0018300 [Buddleja alternifolia]|uniref:Mitochondrial protein n=1 Tax=Buddleja alternifolia TaxID=168488 RepID=A0AAV6XC98_9LAMI|nr:hypothetical protein BUALT_Bualt06G0018300 [Buddleja alternifolia]
MIITGEDTSGISELQQYLSHQFEMKNLGSLSYLLGLESINGSPTFQQFFVFSAMSKNFVLWTHFSSSSSLMLSGYSNIDLAGDRTDRRSPTGYCFLLGDSLISLRSKKQQL